MPGSPWASVVIPAHNEEQVIGRCLRALQDGVEAGELEIVVVANGCADDTVETARSAVPLVRVVTLAEASKIAALNAGDAVATAFPRAYVDADVELSASSLRAVVEDLNRTGFHYGGPQPSFELADRPWYVRLFYRAFHALPYAANEPVGGGVYVLSEVGRARFDQFPDLVADDLYVRNLFQAHERRSVPGCTVVVHPPRTLRGLLATRERVYRGNREYAQRGFRSMAEPTFDVRALLRTLQRDPAATLVFVAVNLVARLRVRIHTATVGWERDNSSRG